MNTALKFADIIALAPLLTLLGGGLLILILDMIFPAHSKKIAALTAALTMGLALASTLLKGELGPLLTPWITNDSLARFFTPFFLSVGIASVFLAAAFFQRFNVDQAEYYFLLITAVAGAILIGISTDFLTLFLGIETLSISLYVLCGYMKKWTISHEAAIKYFITGATATAFLLYGIALVYGATGTTRLDSLLSLYKNLAGTDQYLFLAGIAMITVGLGFKAAIIPFHTWAPDVYDGAPTPLTAFLAVGSKAAAFAAFIRIFMYALPGFDAIWNEAIALIAYPTLIYANIVALRQRQIRRFFAYSGISHAGYMLMMLAAGTPAAQSALLYYIVVYSFATLGAFAAIASIDRDSTGPLISDLRGFFTHAPFQALLLGFCMLTLAGIPPTPGFIAKFSVFKVAFQEGYYGLVITGLIMAVLSAFYYLRIIALTFANASSSTEEPRTYSPALAVAAGVFVSLFLLMLYPTPLIDLVAKITN